MAARIPRRTFARPFVVTLIAAPACYTSTTSPPPEPPQQEQPATPPATPPQPPPPHVIANPPRPQPAAPADGTRWTVFKNQNGCEAAVKVECPKPVDGHVVTCNPPPPRPYTCPENVSLDVPITVVATGGECMVERAPVQCPPHTMCNPPPPRKVTCPQ